MASTPSKANEPTALDFSALLPSNSQKSIYPHINTLDGQRIVFKAGGSEDQGKTFFIVLHDDRKFSVPKSVAEKCAKALAAAKNEHTAGRGNGMVGATVKKLDRGVRLS